MFLIGLITGCGNSDQVKPQAEEPAKRTESTTPGGAARAVELSEDVQRLLQVKAETLKAAASVPSTTAVGRVMDPASLVTDVNELAAAGAIANASAQEFSRTNELTAQGTASVRAVQAAEANAIRDRSLAQSIRDRIALNWGGVLANRHDLPSVTQKLATLERVLVRVDLPVGERVAGLPRGARVSSVVDGGTELNMEFVGLAPMTDSQLQGRSYFLLSRANAVQLTPGAAVNAVIEWAGAQQHGAFVPQSAVVRQDLKTWVYVQVSSTRFERRPVFLQTMMPKGWLVTQGLVPGERVVTQGAQPLLSEEAKPDVVAE